MRLLVEALEKQRFGAKPRSATAESTKLESAKPKVAPKPADKTPRRRGRYIPAALRRAVFERDRGRCAFVDDRGVRCCETHLLEIHHLQPYAKNGQHTLKNLGLRCHAHNDLAAEQDFGREYMAAKKQGAPPGR